MGQFGGAYDRPGNSMMHEYEIPGPQKDVKYWSFWLFIMVLGHYFTYFGGPGMDSNYLQLTLRCGVQFSGWENRASRARRKIPCGKTMFGIFQVSLPLVSFWFGILGGLPTSPGQIEETRLRDN